MIVPVAIASWACLPRRPSMRPLMRRYGKASAAAGRDHHSCQCLTLKEKTVALIKRHGATGYTLTKVEGEGERGVLRAEGALLCIHEDMERSDHPEPPDLRTILAKLAIRFRRNHSLITRFKSASDDFILWNHSFNNWERIAG